MRKFVTVLLMITMLAMPSNMALAVKSGSGSGSGENKGGNDANVTMEMAVARPAFFITIAITQILVMTTLFAPRSVIGKSRDAVLLTLAMTGTLTLAYFLYVMTELYRYIIYQVLFSLPYFNQYNSSNRVSSQEVETEDDVWRISNADALAAAQTRDIAPPAVIITDEEAAIDRAVERALRDPELAEKYLEFASPKVRAAVRNALNNQFEEQVRNRFSVREGSGGDFDAFRAE